jgi:hypothetical protein
MSAVLAVKAQPIISTFDTLYLSQPDTFYVNYSAPGTDVGFDDAEIHFPCVYDTAFGFSFWSYGFAYSNMIDSTTSGLSNQYAAKTGIGYNGSPNYAVAYGATNKVRYANNPGWKNFGGFYVTNSTYAYNSMRDGDAFAKKFGGVTGNDPDWFKLTIKRYVGGQLYNDSIDYYLADFRDPNNANDYIVNDWQWVDLTPIAHADSLLFTLSSSDTGQFGMNTPAYFCIDNFTINPVWGAVGESPAAVKAKIYPVPAVSELTVEVEDRTYTLASVLNMTGKVLANYPLKGEITAIPTTQLPVGTYLLRLSNGTSQISVRFIKQ